MLEKFPEHGRGTEPLDTERRPREEKEAEDTPTETTTSSLRGKLLEQIESAKRAESEELSKLRGSLLGKRHDEAEPTSALRGSLLNKKDGGSPPAPELPNSPEEAEPDAEPFSDAWLKSQTFIQRDGGHRWIVDKFVDTTYGRRVRLKNLEVLAFLVKGMDNFVEALKTPGSPWSVQDPEHRETKP